MAEQNLEGLERVGRLMLQERQDDPAFVKAGNQLVEIVAELFAAREVVKAADSLRSWMPMEIREALENYDTTMAEFDP